MYLEEFVRAGPNIFNRKHMKGFKGPNQLLYDFGVANAENDKEVQQKIEEIDKTFHLVMILENFQVVNRFPCSKLILCIKLGVTDINERSSLLGNGRYKESQT